MTKLVVYIIWNKDSKNIILEIMDSYNCSIAIEQIEMDHKEVTIFCSKQDAMDIATMVRDIDSDII
jgi:hypothetical protein